MTFKVIARKTSREEESGGERRNIPEVRVKATASENGRCHEVGEEIKNFFKIQE